MLQKLIITSFRGIQNEEFLFGKKTHIVGKNGSGKTHILDAIHLLAGAKNIYGNNKLDSEDRIEAFFGQEFLTKDYIFMNSS